MKKISVIVPVYNRSEYLERCLNSIINQNLQEIEIICVNDASTDNSLEILEKYRNMDERIIVIDKKWGGGVSSARNEALKLAGGEYCLNVDSDDWIEQGYLKEIYEKAKNENLDMLISDAIFDCETEGKKELKKDLNIKENEVLTGKEYLKIFFSKNFHGYTWNKLIKREYYNRHNIYYDEKIFLYEDVEVVSMLALHMNRIGKLNKAYYHYVRGENNGSRKVKFKNYLDIERCFEKIREYYSKNNVDSELIELLRFREEYSLL